MLIFALPACSLFGIRTSPKWMKEKDNDFSAN
jgi:hypothetical protein